MKETDILWILEIFVLKIVYFYSTAYIYLFIICMYLINSYLLALNDFHPSD